MSAERKFNGITVPRSGKGNRSGPTTCLSRALAEEVFPINENLVAEDMWISAVAQEQADLVLEDEGVVVKYRIHAGNSNPRHKPFRQMSEALHSRHIVYQHLLARKDYAVLDSTRLHLEALVRAEELRYSGRVTKLLLLKSIPIADRASYAMTARPSLFKLRTTLNRFLMGRR